MTKNSITLSPKHGVNPSVLRCICCGKDYGGAMIIEVVDGETGNNPCRTGRLVGVSKDFKERNHLENSIMYMPKNIFSKVFGEVDFCKQ